MGPTPIGIHADQPLSWAFMAVAGVFFLVGVVYVVRTAVRGAGVPGGRAHGGRALPALALLGGLIASLEEPWINVLIKLWYPPDAPWVVFTAIGHPQPLYVHLVYPGFVGLGSYLVYRGLLARPDGARLWPAFAVIAVLDLAFELPATATGVFSYYGPQPFQVFDGAWPIWPAFVNAAGPVLGGWLIHRLEPLLRGTSRPLLALLPPLAYAGVYGATGWPTYTLLNTDVPAPLRALAALITIALCLAVTQMLHENVRRSAAAQLPR